MASKDAEAGREPGDVGIDARVSVAEGLGVALDDFQKYSDIGLDYVGVNTMKAGYTSLDQHIAALREFAGAAS